MLYLYNTPDMGRDLFVLICVSGGLSSYRAIWLPSVRRPLPLSVKPYCTSYPASSRFSLHVNDGQKMVDLVCTAFALEIYDISNIEADGGLSLHWR
jgi:hypothetical protein